MLNYNSYCKLLQQCKNTAIYCTLKQDPYTANSAKHPFYAIQACAKLQPPQLEHAIIATYKKVTPESQSIPVLLDLSTPSEDTSGHIAKNSTRQPQKSYTNYKDNYSIHTIIYKPRKLKAQSLQKQGRHSSGPGGRTLVRSPGYLN